MSATAAAPATPFLTEIPSSLKQLARLVARGFYSTEDSLILDMLVRYPCMREDDISNLLKFDKKMVRAKVAVLRKDKLIQVKQRIETDEDGKVVKMNCYFINYKVFVNIVKYKLDHMRKKMEMSERDATSRSSFKCTGCNKDFTDLEFDQLFVPMTGELRCTYCSAMVEEDESAGPKKDSRLVLAKFNEQMEKLYDLLHAVENIKLDPSLLEPEPVEIGTGGKGPHNRAANKSGAEVGGKWSGEATRGIGLRPEEQDIKIDFDEDKGKVKEVAKDVPVWITQSTVEGAEGIQNLDQDTRDSSKTDVSESSKPVNKNHDDDEVTKLLIQYEKRNQSSSSTAATANIPGVPDSDSDKSDDSDLEDAALKAITETKSSKNVDEMSSDDDADDGIPTVKVGDEEITVTDVTEDIIEKMTAEEKEHYTQIFQDFYSHMYD